MKTEFEATFPNIDKQPLRNLLIKNGAVQIHPEFLQKRVVFHLPRGHEIEGGWLRVRQEYDKVTMSIKSVTGNQISDQKELCLIVDDFDSASNFLHSVGCTKKAYQENRRELWMMDAATVTLDEWPYLEPFAEVEGASESVVRSVVHRLGLDYHTAIFGAVDTLYARRYGISEDFINNHTPHITFDRPNPFLTHDF